MAKVLILKLGYSETLDKEIGITTSLGDVIRTTVILNYLKGDDTTWLVDEKAYPLLKGNPCIKRILIFNLESVLQLQRERFDTVINLEKGPGICALSDSISAWRRFGFRFDADNGVAQAYDGAEKVLSLCLDLEKKKGNLKFWQEALASMIGKKWSENDEYILGHKSNTPIKYDIGFNWVVGSKWPNKAWQRSQWERLEELLKGQYSISWQKGLDNLSEYIDWVHSCRLIVTNDSLGMHLAIALKRKIVALFGPTSSREVYLYKRGVVLSPKVSYDCVPCLQSKCFQKKPCLDFIKPEDVKRSVVKLLPPRRKKS
ncbi:MAG: glycosyltransferase family 9 protein [Candidatus Omnitrophota bacterium]